MPPITTALQVDGLPGWLLIVGGVAVVLLAAASATVPATMWTGSPDVSLPVIAQHTTIWRLANLGFAVATVLTAAGLFVLPASVGARGAGLAMAAATGYALAGALWLITLAIRLGITPGVAAAYVANGSVDPGFVPLARLGGALFAAFIVIGCASLAVLGLGALLGGFVPAWAGWITLALSLGILGGYLATGDTLPAFVYLPTILLGAVLLLAG